MTLGLALLALLFALGLPLLCALIAVANVRKYRVKALPCEATIVPSDLRRRILPWLSRLGHFGFRQVQIARLDSAGYAEAYRWTLLNEEEKTFATIEWTVPVSGAGPRVSLSMFTARRDGTLVVTLDHRLTRNPPAWWQDVQRHFATITAQWNFHYTRIRGDQERVLPEGDKFTAMLAADEEARHEALVQSGEFTPSRQDPDILRLRFSQLPSRVLPLLADFFKGRYFGSCTRRDVAAPAKPRSEEIERVGGAIGLSLNQAVEQDLARYRALIAVRSSPLEHLRHILVLLGTVAFFIALFGHDQPLQTAVTVILLAALHEAGHWLPMRLFGYRGVSPIFIPFTGGTERAHKLHAPAWQQLIVLLTGPLPGLIAGLTILGHGYSSPDIPTWLLDGAGIAVALNALHLLPVLPMDGGKVIDLLVFRDLPLLRPFFTVTTSILTFAVALVLKSRVLRCIATAMFGGVLWDVKTIEVVRGARRLPWAGEINDESEALRRIFRGLREEGQGTFVGSDGWHRKIEVLLMEVMRKRPHLATRFAGGTLLAVSGAVPALLMGSVLLGPVIGDAGRMIRTAEYVTEFRKHFPGENRVLHPEEKSALISLATETETGSEGESPLLDRPRDTAARLLPRIGGRLDQLDWEKAKIAACTDVIGAQVLHAWVEVQCLQMERAAAKGESGEALQRAEAMLGVLGAVEPATSLEQRQLLAAAELRVLGVIERENAQARLDPDANSRLDARISARNVSPNPDIEGLLLVAAWAERSRQAALDYAAQQASFDPRFWRDLYPRISTVQRLIAEHNSTHIPASVALARYWRLSRRVGELPPAIGMPVAVSPGEASLILQFCEEHRRLAWRRQSAISALRLEAYRRKSGTFPPLWKHSVPGGASMELILKPEPLLRLTDRRDQIQRRIPSWLTPPSLPLPPIPPAFAYDAPLFGASPATTVLSSQ